MTAEEGCLYAGYYYNSVLEFIYFIILYIKTHGTASVNSLSKHVKFFKIEVNTFISSFEGKTPEDKLCEMLKLLDCFLIYENTVKVNNNINIKDSIFESLVLIKCVDLLLRGVNNIDDICNTLKFSNVILISKQDLLCIIKKHSYMSVSNNQTVTLHHVHGLLGFEDYLYNSVIYYFYTILYHGKILSFKEIRSHIKSLPHCGMSNIIGIFSILNCASQFDCENGYVLLKKKSKKYKKLKPISIEKMEVNFSSRSLFIGQVVYSIYGHVLYRWSGEIGKLSENSGVIYSVVEFTNGHQGVFNVYFNKEALKVISGVDNLTKYINLCDVVEFDAEYCSSKILDRCWKATRVKFLSSNKFEYNELLIEKLSCDSELQRNKCANDMCCLKINLNRNYIASGTKDEKHSSEKRITTHYESHLLRNSFKDLEIFGGSKPNECNSENTEVSHDLPISILNIQKPDYMFMFGCIHTLMENKGIAVANHENKFYSIIFMLDSVFASNKSEHLLLKGQKILAFIPYIRNLESVCVATLVYGLNKEESNETETANTSPKHFASKIFLLNIKKDLCSKTREDITPMLSICTKSNSLDVLQDSLSSLNSCVKNERNFKSPDINHKCNQLINNEAVQDSYTGDLCKKNSTRRIAPMSNLSTKSNSLNIMQDNLISLNSFVKSKRKFKSLDIDYKCDSLINIKSESCIMDLSKELTNGDFTTKLNVKSISLDAVSSLCSLNSYKTCSTGSSEIFYSCESNCNTPQCLSSLSIDGKMSTNNENLPCEVNSVSDIKPIVPLPTILNDKCNILSVKSASQEFKMKSQQHLKNGFKHFKYDKYLSLQSTPSLKCTFPKKKSKILPDILKITSKNCDKNYLKTKANVLIITDSFFFFATNIEGCNIVLPLPKQCVPPGVQKKIKLNSCGELTVIQKVLINLSHIIAIRIFI